MSIFKQLIKQLNKKKILVATIVLLLSLVTGIGYLYYQSQIQTIYHVYLNGDRIGIVDDPKLIENWIEQKIKNTSDQFRHIQIQENNQLTYEEEKRYKPTVDNEAALNNLKEEFSIMASAVKLYIDGQFIAYVADRKNVEEVIEEIKKEYVPGESLLTVNSSNEKKKNVVSISSIDETDATLEDISEANTITKKAPMDEPLLLEANVKQELETEETFVHPSQVISYEQLKERLFEVKVDQNVYTVQEGDVLGTIAVQNGLSLKELLYLNPGLKEDSVIQIGQKLVVIEEEPYITVATVETVMKEEDIPFQVETKLDPNMYRGESRTAQEGKVGTKLVEYLIYKENGRKKRQEIVNEEILIEPVNRVILRGDKEKPSRGSGQFKWPTYGGVITSGFGQRWGRLHAGIDIAGVSNRTIMASDAGTVTTAGWDNGYGNYVIIDHSNGYQTLYAHLASINVKRGQFVQKGEKLGIMGTTGQSTGIHLHFEVIKNGKTVNPLIYLKR